MLRNILTTAIAALFLVSLVFAADKAESGKDKPDSVKAKAEKVQKTAEKAAEKSAEKKEKKVPEWTETESGLKYRDIVQGKGQAAENGDKVEVHYTLWLADGDEPGKKLQSSKDRGQTFPFKVGQRGLIQGWNEGMVGMMEGGTRQMILPPEIAYGEEGRPPLVPGNATLFFEIDLVKLHEK